MNEDKIIEVKEEQVSVTTSATPNSVEAEEKVEDVVVQVATPLSLEVEDENIIDIEVEEAFPYLVTGILDNTIGEKDVLIDGGIANVENNDDTVGLQEIIEAAAAQGGSGTVDHSLLNGRELSDQHPISAISGLRDELDDIEAIKRVYSSENGLSEFRKWNDGNPNMDNRAGYFVKLVQGTENIEICTDEDDVYGIAVTNSGFVGGQVQSDRSDDPSYAMVGIAGALRVRTDGTARNGEYVVPNALGEATFSANNCGYKVISQGSYASYPYVTIAVTPQNDKLSKVYGMLTDTSSGGTIGNLIIQIEDLESKVQENDQRVDIIVSDNESIKDILAENQNNIKEVTDISNTALEAAQEAKDSVASAVESANDATRKAQAAALEAQNAASDLADVSQLADEMEVLISYEHNGETGIAGLVAATNENTMNLGAVMETVDEQKSEIASIMMTSDENGTRIQHLVSRIDRYSIGQYSTSEGLTYDEAQSILVDEYIYVCTKDHIESMSADTPVEVHFERPDGILYSYLWTPASDESDGSWSQYGEVSTATVYADGANEGDLWYCWQDVEELNEDGSVVTTYIPGTLYAWMDGKWIAVATVSNNNRSRILSSTKQTADEIKSEVVDARGNFSSLKQNFDSINSTIGDIQGNVSTVSQRVDGIDTAISNINGTVSSLQQHATDTDASIALINTGRFHVLYQSYIGAAPEVYEGGNKYSLVPMWDDEQDEQGVFVFNEEFVDNTDGIYYFYSDDHTKYCKVVDDGYEIYTIGNQATSALNSRVTDNEASISELNEFKTKTTESLTNITSKTEENAATISSVAARYYHPLISVDDEAPEMFGDYKYTSEPTWNVETGTYEFDINDRSDTGIYYMADENNQSYCKVVTTGDGNTLYEIYGLVGGSSASIIQKVDDNSSAIGLMVERIENVIDEDGNLTDESVQAKGSIIVKAINGQSTVTINADKIDLEGYVTVSSLTETGTTVIDGSRIQTGIIHSNGYSYTSGNTYTTNGTFFDLSNGTIRSTNFAIDGSGNAYFKGNIEAKSGTIGGFTIGESALYNKRTSLDGVDDIDPMTGVYLGTDGISIGQVNISQATYTDIDSFTITAFSSPAFKVTADGDIFCANIDLPNGANIYPADMYFLKDVDAGESISGVGVNLLSTKGIQLTNDKDTPSYISGNGGLGFILTDESNCVSITGATSSHGHLNIYAETMSSSENEEGRVVMTTNSDIKLSGDSITLESNYGVGITPYAANDTDEYFVPVASDAIKFSVGTNGVNVYEWDSTEKDWVKLGKLYYE